MNKRSLFLILFRFIISVAFAQTKSQVNQDYINKYSSIAVAKMKQHGIPASITLAQGILESGAGNSVLTKKSNNHFGIKCHDWTGEKVYHDDDKKDDCFRKYAKAEDSFEDHSKFLKRPRYAMLYNLEITDYKGWARGLKKCGYATDPNYANRLISLIELYELYKYDIDIVQTEISDEEKAIINAESNYQLKSSMGSIQATPSHDVVKIKGRKAVIAKPGDTYEDIAKEFGLRKWEIRWYNKVKKGQLPEEGAPVYLRK